MDKYTVVLILVYLALVVVVTFSSTKKKKKRRKVFFLSFFFSLIAGVFWYINNMEKSFSVTSSKYVVKRYKCERCGYKFDEKYDECPICEKEGFHEELEEVQQVMT